MGRSLHPSTLKCHFQTSWRCLVLEQEIASFGKSSQGRCFLQGELSLFHCHRCCPSSGPTLSRATIFPHPGYITTWVFSALSGYIAWSSGLSKTSRKCYFIHLSSDVQLQSQRYFDLWRRTSLAQPPANQENCCFENESID